jgi:DNA-binding response OmpR family regulator
VRVLLVEDHERLGESLVEALNAALFTVDWVRSLENAAAFADLNPYDVVLLDLGLPDGDGLDLIRTWRASGRSTPVLVLTARGELNDRVRGLDDGADDYLVKPFELREMISRCRALLRRPGDMAPAVLRMGELEVDITTGAATFRGIPLALNRREQQLLLALVRRPGKVCSRAYLEGVLYDHAADPTLNALEVSVSRLRSALRASGLHDAIRTVRGVGYVFAGAAPHATY